MKMTQCSDCSSVKWQQWDCI